MPKTRFSEGGTEIGGKPSIRVYGALLHRLKDGEHATGGAKEGYLHLRKPYGFVFLERKNV